MERRTTGLNNKIRGSSSFQKVEMCSYLQLIIYFSFMFTGSYRQKEQFGVLKLFFPDKRSPRSSSKDKIESETRDDRYIVPKIIYLAHWVVLHIWTVYCVHQKFETIHTNPHADAYSGFIIVAKTWMHPCFPRDEWTRKLEETKQKPPTGSLNSKIWKVYFLN